LRAKKSRRKVEDCFKIGVCCDCEANVIFYEHGESPPKLRLNPELFRQQYQLLQRRFDEPAFQLKKLQHKSVGRFSSVEKFF